MAETGAGTALVYDVDEAPRSMRDWLIYTGQWVVTMMYAVVWGYAIVGVALGYEGDELTRYMAAIVATTGLSTLVQAWVGHRFAMVSGPNVIPSLAIVAAMGAGGLEYAEQAFLAQAIAGVLIAVLGLVGLTRMIEAVWSPLILGSMVLMVGLSVAGVGLELMVSGEEAGWILLVAVALALGGATLALRGRGVLATLPPLFVIGVGYIVFAALGEVDWSLVGEQPMLALPELLPHGLEMPPLDLILIMVVVNLMAALNLYGNLRGYAGVVGHEIDSSRDRRTFSLFGLVETTLPGLLGVPATVAYGENLGIVQLTRVAARRFIIAAAAIFLALSLLGPAVGVMAAMPEPVAGAVLLGIASTVVGIGAHMMTTAPAFKRREQVLVGFSVFLALGLYQLPDGAWDGVPRVFETVFGNPIISVILFVMAFEQLIFRGVPSEPAEEDDAGEEDDGGDGLGTRRSKEERTT